MYIVNPHSPMVVRMHIQSVQLINHLDVLKKGRGERTDAGKAVQITTSLLRLLENVQMFLDVT